MGFASDGDQLIRDSKEAREVKEFQKASKDAKEVQLMVRNALPFRTVYAPVNPEPGPGLFGLWSVIQER